MQPTRPLILPSPVTVTVGDSRFPCAQEGGDVSGGAARAVELVGERGELFAGGADGNVAGFTSDFDERDPETARRTYPGRRPVLNADSDQLSPKEPLCDCSRPPKTR